MNRLLTLVMLSLAVLLMLNSFCFGQGFIAYIANTSYVVTEQCHYGNPMPDGTVCTIYWDANGNGVDAADQPAPLCSHPPACVDGPDGTVNLNSFQFNSQNFDQPQGTFFLDSPFVSTGSLPNPPRYYLAIGNPCSAPAWRSRVMTFHSGINEVNLNGPYDWWCTNPAPPPCWPDMVTILPVPTPSTRSRACICAGAMLCDPAYTIFVGPFANACFESTPGGISLMADFGSGDCCDPTFWPAQGWVLDQGLWTWSLMNGQRYLTKQFHMPGGESSWGHTCVEVFMSAAPPDCNLPVTFGTFTALPLDNAVKLSWNTLSENDVARFEVLRDGALIHIEDATNTTTEHQYTFMDNNVVNGTTYVYELVTVNIDGTVRVEATRSAQPNANYASVTEYALHQNFPNPFNPTTSIRFDLPTEDLVMLKVWTTTGREISTLVSGKIAAGVHYQTFDGNGLPSGMYFYTLKTGSGYNMTRKMLLLK